MSAGFSAAFCIRSCSVQNLGNLICLQSGQSRTHSLVFPFLLTSSNPMRQPVFKPHVTWHWRPQPMQEVWKPPVFLHAGHCFLVLLTSSMLATCIPSSSH